MIALAFIHYQDMQNYKNLVKIWQICSEMYTAGF